MPKITIVKEVLRKNSAVDEELLGRFAEVVAELHRLGWNPSPGFRLKHPFDSDVADHEFHRQPVGTHSANSIIPR